MAVKDLKKYIKEHDGMIISEATLLTSDLLLAAYVVIRGSNLRPKFRKELESLIMQHHSYWGHLHHPLDYIETEAGNAAYYLWNEDIFNYFNDIAPKGYYFGSHEGDGACIGWFQYEEEVC